MTSSELKRRDSQELAPRFLSPPTLALTVQSGPGNQLDARGISPQARFARFRNIRRLRAMLIRALPYTGTHLATERPSDGDLRAGASLNAVAGRGPCRVRASSAGERHSQV